MRRRKTSQIRGYFYSWMLFWLSCVARPQVLGKRTALWLVRCGRLRWRTRSGCRQHGQLRWRLTERQAPPRKKRKRKEAEHPTLAAKARKWLGKHVSLHLERGFDAADLGQGLENAGGEKHYKTRFELFLRVVRRFETCAGGLDPVVANNLDRVFRTVDNHRRYERLPWKSKAYGSAFRNEMKALLAACQAGDSSALAEWVRLWSARAGVRADVVA